MTNFQFSNFQTFEAEQVVSQHLVTKPSGETQIFYWDWPLDHRSNKTTVKKTVEIRARPVGRASQN